MEFTSDLKEKIPMTIVFVSNYYNHHQSSMSYELDLQTDHNFYFIETEPLEQERKNMGWGNEKKPPYVFQSYTDEASRIKAQDIIENADVVIWGSCPFSMIRPRLKQKKLTFLYSERLFKEASRIRSFARSIKYILKLKAYQKNHYLLCSSAYASSDYNKIGLFKNRTFKWGYFPEVKKYDDIDSLIAAKEPHSILWVARFIELKHPELPLYVARRLKEEGYYFKLDMIGNGELIEKIRSDIDRLELQNNVRVLGAMSPEKVREHMESSQIFLFTSDQNEGWGAVVNESMNSACAVIANAAIGSVPFMIKNGINGFSYDSTDALYQRVKQMIDDPTLAQTVGSQAYRSLTDEWNALTAVNRLLNVIKTVSNGEEPMELYRDGICSNAANIS